MSTKPTVRCYDSQLTRLQALVMIARCVDKANVPEGVLRSLRRRGLLTFDVKTVTPAGFDALMKCSFLTRPIHEWLSSLRDDDATILRDIIILRDERIALSTLRNQMTTNGETSYGWSLERLGRALGDAVSRNMLAYEDDPAGHTYIKAVQSWRG